MDQEGFELLDELLFVVPQCVAVLLLVVVQVVDPLGILYEIGFLGDDLRRGSVRQIPFIDRVATVQDEVQYRQVHLALVGKQLVVNLAFEILKFSVDERGIRVGRLHAALVFVPCGRGNGDACGALCIASPEVPEMNNGFALGVYPVQDDELSCRDSWFY